MRHLIGYLLVWLSGGATLFALLLIRDRWFRPTLPPATARQLARVRTANRRHLRADLPSLYGHPRDGEDTLDD